MHTAHITKETLPAAARTGVVRYFIWHCSCGAKSVRLSSYSAAERSMDTHIIANHPRLMLDPHFKPHPRGMPDRPTSRCEPAATEKDWRRDLERGDQLEIRHLNVYRLHLWQYSDGGFGWTCGCGATGGSGNPSKKHAATRAIAHVWRIHRPHFPPPYKQTTTKGTILVAEDGSAWPEPPPSQPNDPSRVRTREDPVEIPIVSPNVQRTDDAHDDDPVDELSSQQLGYAYMIALEQGLTSLQIVKNRWELFTDEELVALNQSTRDRTVQLRDPVASKLKIETCEELVRRGVPVHGSCR